MVCMAIEGAMQIEGGNWQIFSGMLNASYATTLLNTTVTSISKSKSKYSVKTSTPDSVTGTVLTNEEPFDTVILAAPLQFSSIDLPKGLLKRIPDEIPYVTLHVTLFTSPHALNQTYFNLSPTDEVPSTILTTLPKEATPPSKPEDSVGSPGFFSISTLRKVINPESLEIEYLYKIFSPKAVTSDFLSQILNVDGTLPVPSSLPSALCWIFCSLFNSSRESHYHKFRDRESDYLVLSPWMEVISISLSQGDIRRSGIGERVLLHERNGELH